MANKKLSFKHISGSQKFIPGIDDADLAPKMEQKFIVNPEAGPKPFPVMQRVPGHISHIILVDETFEPLSEADQKLPEAVQAHIEKEHVEDMLLRRNANALVRNALQHYARSNDIEIISETEMDAAELLVTEYPIVQLSEIAQNDHETRGIPIPASLQNKSDTERARATKQVAKDKAAAKLAAEEAKLLAEMEAEEALKKKS
jgi:hypothetical protein